MGMGDRIRERLTALGISGAELARRVGLKQPTISALISGKSRSSAHLHLIARELETTPEYLTGETDDPSSSAVRERQLGYRAPDPELGDLVEVAVSDVAYGMGGAYVDDASAQTTVERFPRAFIRQFTKGPFAQLYFASGIGDSMTPTIHHSDLLLIDRSQEQLRLSDQLWAVHAGTIGMIKRVRVLPDGSILLVSDNPDVSDYPVAHDELHIIGRVVAVVKRV